MLFRSRVDRTVLISDGKVSTEKLKKHPAMEYTVLDKAHRIKLTDEMLGLTAPDCWQESMI